MYLSDAQRRLLALWMAYLWAGMSIAGGIGWLAVSRDEYRHLPEWWWRMWDDLPGMFPQSLGISLAVAGFLHYLGLPARKKLPVNTAVAVSGVMWLIISFIMSCFRGVSALYLDHVIMRILSGSPGVRTLWSLLMYQMSAWMERLWMPLGFALLVGLVVFAMSFIPPFRQWVTRPALFVVVGLAAGVLVESVWWWLELPGRGYFGHHDYWWIAYQFAIAFGSLHAFLFSVVSRHLVARREYWEGRGDIEHRTSNIEG